MHYFFHKYRKLLFSALGFLSLSASAAYAQITPIALQNPSNISDLGEFINRLIEFATAFVAVIAVLYLIISGFQYIMAGGDQKKVGAARSAIQNTIIGLVIVVGAFVVVKFVLINFLDVKTSFFGDWQDRASELGI